MRFLRPRALRACNFFQISNWKQKKTNGVRRWLRGCPAMRSTSNSYFWLFDPSLPPAQSFLKCTKLPATTYGKLLETNGGLPVVTLTKTSGTISKASRSNSKNKPSPPPPTKNQQSTLQNAELNFTINRKKVHNITLKLELFFGSRKKRYFLFLWSVNKPEV